MQILIKKALLTFIGVFLLSSNLMAVEASKEYEIVVVDKDVEVDKCILKGLENFNIDFFKRKYESFELETFVIYAKDFQMIGGVNGYLVNTGVESFIGIDYVWVNPSRRHEGIGTALFKEVEAIALRFGCSHIQLFTLEYQAPDFYRKLGFECVGVIPAWIDGYDALFFRKTLL